VTRTRSPQPEVLDEVFADNLHALRTKQKVTRRQLAELTGIPWHSIEKIETGHGTGRRGLRRRVSIGEAVVLAQALGVRPGALLAGAPKPDGGAPC
jgi:transcriptional regulator with XRE-family HTH domain